MNYIFVLLIIWAAIVCPVVAHADPCKNHRDPHDNFHQHELSAFGTLWEGVDHEYLLDFSSKYFLKFEVYSRGGTTQLTTASQLWHKHNADCSGIEISSEYEIKSPSYRCVNGGITHTHGKIIDGKAHGVIHFTTDIAIPFDFGFQHTHPSCLKPTTPATTPECTDCPDPQSLVREPTPAKIFRRRNNTRRCALGWSPTAQFQHNSDMPEVMIYALEFEYDVNSREKYVCTGIEIRVGDDIIENLAGWNLYLGTLYNPSRQPLEIPEAYGKVIDNKLRLTPDMFNLVSFPVNIVGMISHPLPGFHYILKNSESILVDTAYSCFAWGSTASKIVDGVDVDSPRRILSTTLREMDLPRLERYILDGSTGHFTYMEFDKFMWDSAVVSDWLLPEPENAPDAPSISRPKINTAGMWADLKRKRN